MDLDFVRIECETISETPSRLTPAFFETLRKFDAYFRASCCLNVSGECSSCHEYQECPYRIVFSQQLSHDPEIIRFHQKPSLPFSMYISETSTDSTTCTVGIVVIGSAINYIGLFHAALRRMVEAAIQTALPEAKYALRFYNLDYQDIRHEIHQSGLLPENVILLSGRHILENTVHSEFVSLTFTSPLRLITNGSIAHRFDFMSFFRSQLRRCSSLSAYYGSGRLDLDFAGLSLASQNVSVVEDTVRFTQPAWTKRLNKAGLTGSAECIGLVEPMVSLLLLGSYFNAGKGAAFGMGYHKLEVK